MSHERQPPTTSLAKLCLYLYLYLRVRYTSYLRGGMYLLPPRRVKSQESWTSKPTVLSSPPTSCADTIKLVSNQNLFQTCNVAIAYMHACDSRCLVLIITGGFLCRGCRDPSPVSVSVAPSNAAEWH